MKVTRLCPIARPNRREQFFDWSWRLEVAAPIRRSFPLRRLGPHARKNSIFVDLGHGTLQELGLAGLNWTYDVAECPMELEKKLEPLCSTLGF